jgi:predicted dehydrogenase
VQLRGTTYGLALLAKAALRSTPSTIDFTTKREPEVWFSPRWKETWFPDAFEGTMGMLLDAVAQNTEPAVSAADNLRTMALVEACYKSLDLHRPVRLDEIKENS